MAIARHSHVVDRSPKANAFLHYKSFSLELVHLAPGGTFGGVGYYKYTSFASS